MKKNILLFFSMISCTIIKPYNDTALHRYLWANYSHFSGNLASAQSWYSTLINNHCSLYSYKGYLNFLLDTKQYNHIVNLMPELDKKFENDPEIQLIFVQALEKINKITEADKKIIKISSLCKTNSEITLRAAQTYIRRKEPENALITINTFLNNTPRRPNNFVFYFLKSQINIQLNKLSDALKDIQLCLEMHPQFDKAWLILATLQEQQGELQKAISGYGTFLELSGGNATIEKHIATLILRTKSQDKQSPFKKSYFEQALILFDKKNYSAALSINNTHLQQHPHDEEAQLLKIKLLAHLEQYDIVSQFCAELLSKQPQTLQAIPQCLYLLSYSMRNNNQLIHVLEKLSTQYPHNYWLSLYAADLYIRTHKIDNAIPLLEKSLKNSTDRSLNAKIYYQLSLIDYEKDNYPAMITHLEHGYNLDKNLPHLNNSLAYYWTTKGKDTIKAQKFINAALASNSNNPYFLDTQALIWYKEQKYTQAQTLLEQLNAQHTATSLLHLAKTHYKLNNKNDAALCTQKAASLTLTQHDEKTLQKLQQLLTTHD